MNMRPSVTTQLLAWGFTLFVLTSLGISYLWLNHLTPNDLSLGVILIAYSPSIAALLAAAVTGKSGDLLAQLIRWRTSPWHYGVALGIPVVAVGSAIVTANTATSGIIFDPLGITLGIGAIIAGSVGEEFGWRGYLQPRLMRRHNLFWASIAVGVVWATWHCWTILAPQGFSGAWATDIALTYLRLVPTALLYGWLYHVSKRSLPVVMLAHASHNIAINAFVVPSTAQGFQLALALSYLLLAGVLVALRPADFFSNTPSSTIDRK